MNNRFFIFGSYEKGVGWMIGIKRCPEGQVPVILRSKKGRSEFPSCLLQLFSVEKVRLFRAPGSATVRRARSFAFPFLLGPPQSWSLGDWGGGPWGEIESMRDNERKYTLYCN